MKKTIIDLSLVILALAITTMLFACSPTTDEPTFYPISDITDSGTDLTHHDTFINEFEVNYTRLVNMEDAFIKRESGGKYTSYSKRDHAFGVLQITPIMLRHFHDIVGERVFNMEDLFDPEISRYVFEEVMLHDNPSLDIDKAIDIWNPNCNAAYRNAVKNEFNRLQSTNK